MIYYVFVIKCYCVCVFIQCQSIHKDIYIYIRLPISLYVFRLLGLKCDQVKSTIVDRIRVMGSYKVRRFYSQTFILVTIM